MKSALVIKVIYGDSIRRFTLDVNEYGLVDLDMDGLRAKILSFFEFGPDADLTLTYIDEEFDVVTLVNEDDLFDAIQQPLNPLRIAVKLNGDRTGKCEGSSTPVKEQTQVQQHSLPHINCCYAKFLLAVPQELRLAFLNLTCDWTSKATSLVPELNEFMECLSKLVLAHIFESKAGANSSIQSSASGIAPKVAKGLNTAKDTVFAPKTLPSDEFIFPAPDEFIPPALDIASCTAHMDYWERTKEGTILGNSPASGITGHASASQIDSTFQHICPIDARNGAYGPDVVQLRGKCHFQPCRVSGRSHDNMRRRDHPEFHPVLQPLDQLNNAKTHPQNQSPLLVSQACRKKPCMPKLNGLVIQNLEVMDGIVTKPATPYTEVWPATTFTKIWRMRNNGIVVWPQETQLLWMSGDRLTSEVPVDLKIPVDGIHVNEELDIAVDLTAPEQPGFYYSCWTMALPSGHIFGEDIVVRMMVKARPNDSSFGRVHGSNLIFYPKRSEEKSEEKRDGKADPVSDSLANLNRYLAMSSMATKRPSKDCKLVTFLKELKDTDSIDDVEEAAYHYMARFDRKKRFTKTKHRPKGVTSLRNCPPAVSTQNRKQNKNRSGI